MLAEIAFTEHHNKSIVDLIVWRLYNTFCDWWIDLEQCGQVNLDSMTYDEYYQ